MQQQSNTYYFTVAEKKIIKNLIDTKFGKETSPSDYDSTGGDYDVGLEGHIYQITGERVSGSTLERLTGLRNEKNTGVSLSTLSVVAKYLHFGSLEQLLRILTLKSAASTKNSSQFNVADVLGKYKLCLRFNGEKSLELHHLNVSTFEVIASRNLKLQQGDILEISQARENEELVCSKITRLIKKKPISMGIYKSGCANIIATIDLVKKT
jgi:hypothetical protein